MAGNPERAFTITYSEIRNQIRTSAFIETMVIPGITQTAKKSQELIGIWDTGATRSCISARIAKALGLVSIGKSKVYGVSGPSIKDRYIVNIELPNDVRFDAITVTEADLKDFDVLVGMDVMTQGDVAFTNCNGKSTFSFRTPPTQKIDFAAKARLNDKIGPTHGPGKRKRKKK